MSQLNQDFDKACNEITQNILQIPNPTKTNVKTEIKKICAKYSLNRIPKNYEILSKVSKKDFTKLQSLLLRKPIKTASGVAVIALMPKPYACPHGRCTYCPGGIEYNTPNSYTGHEPSTINAIENNYDPKTQITTKLDKLIAYGHDPTKLELVIVGGTFLFMPKDYQTNFIKSCYDALNGFDSSTLAQAQTANEGAQIRNVGLTIETKPDYCKTPHIDDMLQYGVTRIEIGVQTLQEHIYKLVNRGHTYQDVTESFQAAKDAGYKLVAHMMPGLPTSTPKKDIADFKKLFTDESLKPDMLKIYPSLVLQNTKMYDQYKSQEYTPYSDQDMIHVLTQVKKMVPKWVRIMRVQREISSNEIIAGPKSGNLRQIVHKNLQQQGLSCQCIRCREAGLAYSDGDNYNNSSTATPTTTKQQHPQKDIKMNQTNYNSSQGQEIFLSYEDTNDRIYGFLRLRKPSTHAHRPEIKGNDSSGTITSTIVRELHVYGKSLKLGKRDQQNIQHAGLGKNLMSAAEKISKEQLDAKKILVISAVGTRQYYKKLGYTLQGPYMVKEL